MNMIRPAILWGLLCVCGASLFAQTPVSPILNGIEKRYNSTKTLEVQFTQVYAFGPRQRTESGTLYLEKPGKMRWDYREPANKLFVSDGKFVYLYSPSTNVAERAPFKASDDLRAPLAFLLGRLDFHKDFRRFTLKPVEQNYWIAAEPRSEKAPYTLVAFLVTPQYQILEVEVTGVDQAVNRFRFRDEKRNAPMAASRFDFVPPAGSRVVDAKD
ncbi:MAG: outer membrane lipoprotein carrier protein LolA [Bryobacterales bacterium]|nr:outer membrane lipoprotein carrier protein LolA [Bryobacterales bacterium]